MHLLLWWRLTSPGWTGKCGLLHSGVIHRRRGSPASCTDCCRAKETVRSAFCCYVSCHSVSLNSTSTQNQMARKKTLLHCFLWVKIFKDAAPLATYDQRYQQRYQGRFFCGCFSLFAINLRCVEFENRSLVPPSGTIKKGNAADNDAPTAVLSLLQ